MCYGIDDLCFSGESDKEAWIDENYKFIFIFASGEKCALSIDLILCVGLIGWCTPKINKTFKIIYYEMILSF